MALMFIKSEDGFSVDEQRHELLLGRAESAYWIMRAMNQKEADEKDGRPSRTNDRVVYVLLPKHL